MTNFQSILVFCCAAALAVQSVHAQSRAERDAARAAGVVGNPRTLLLLAVSEAPQKKAKPQPQRGINDQEKFWWKADRQRAAAAAELVLAANPFTIAALRMHGKTMSVWGEEEFPALAALPLTSKWLDAVKDGVFQDYRKGEWRFVPFWDLPGEYKAYCEALVKANDTPLDAFKESAKVNNDARFAHMYNEPDLWRGAVVEITGRLRRVRKYDAPLLAVEDGVKYVYEGWIFPTTPGAHPVCVLFTRLPEKLPVAEDVDARVSFYGYFFKRYRYVTGEQYSDKKGMTHNRQRETLLLIGPTVVLNSAVTIPTRAEQSWTSLFQLVIVVIVVGIGVGALVVLMSFLYRRADDRVHKEIANLRTGKTEMFQDEVSEPK